MFDFILNREYSDCMRSSVMHYCRNNYCVKEVSSLPISLCGKTQYYGDSYVNGECVYKKCDSECVPGKFTFTWDSQQYTRRRYCCNDVNLCNGKTKRTITSSMSKGSYCLNLFHSCIISGPIRDDVYSFCSRTCTFGFYHALIYI